MAILIKYCPICKHEMAQHDPVTWACQVKDCWCRYDPNQEDVEAE